MHPSINRMKIKKVVNLFSRGLAFSVKKIICLCLDLIQIGMSSTLISFFGYYYESHGG